MKSSGRDFRNHLRDCMEHLGYTSCRANPYFCMRNAMQSNEESYYEYLFLYIKDVLAVSEHPTELLQEVDKYFPMKPGSFGQPNIYLGAKVYKIQLLNGVEAYYISTSHYVQ